MVRSAILILDDLPRSQITALQDKAMHLGVTPEHYVKKLIDRDLALDREARTRSMAELAVPFQKVLAGLSVSALDAIAGSVRNKPRPRASVQAVRTRRKQ